MTQTVATTEMRETAAKELIDLPEVDVDTIDPREVSFFEDMEARLYAVAGTGSTGAIELTPSAEGEVVGEPAVIDTESEEFSAVEAAEPQEKPSVDLESSVDTRRNFD